MIMRVANADLLSAEFGSLSETTRIYLAEFSALRESTAKEIEELMRLRCASPSHRFRGSVFAAWDAMEKPEADLHGHYDRILNDRHAIYGLIATYPI